MNKSTNSSSLVLAAGVTGVALFAAVNVATLAGLEVAEVFSFGAALALIGFGLSDYTRRPRSLRLTPSLAPTTVARPAVAAGPRARATAYGLPRNARRITRLAA